MAGAESDKNGEEPEGDPVAAARRSIHVLFEGGYIDDDHATAALLAIDLGRQRVERRGRRRNVVADSGDEPAR